MGKRAGGKQKTSRLSPRHKQAINEYFANGFNKRQALLAAGYSNGTSTHAAASVFNHPIVKAEIERRFDADKRKYDVDRDWVIQRLARIANGGEIMARYKVINEDGEAVWDFSGASADDLAVITELTTDTYIEGRGKDARRVKKMKVAMADPKGALDSLARTLGMFQDNLKLDGDISVVERLQAGRRRVASRDPVKG